MAFPLPFEDPAPVSGMEDDGIEMLLGYLGLNPNILVEGASRGWRRAVEPDGEGSQGEQAGGQGCGWYPAQGSSRQWGHLELSCSFTSSRRSRI